MRLRAIAGPAVAVSLTLDCFVPQRRQWKDAALYEGSRFRDTVNHFTPNHYLKRGVACSARPHFLLKRSDIIKARAKHNFDDDYELNEMCGAGAFGSVFLCRHRHTKLERACKVIQMTSSLDIRLFLKEVSVCMQLDHPHIIRLVEYYEENNQVRLIFRLCSGQDLFDRLCEAIAQRGHFTSMEAAWAMRHMIKGVIGCHSQRIVHRDVKPENFVITDGEKEKEMGLTHAGLRLIDMGLSEYLAGDEDEQQPGGTVFYMAPEVIRGNYTELCDTWSLGVILYLMLVGDPLYPITDSEEETQKVMQDILDPKYLGQKVESNDQVEHALDFSGREGLGEKDARPQAGRSNFIDGCNQASFSDKTYSHAAKELFGSRSV